VRPTQRTREVTIRATPAAGNHACQRAGHAADSLLEASIVGGYSRIGIAANWLTVVSLNPAFSATY
jgi:hypothetical protein